MFDRLRLRPPLVLAYHALGEHRPELDPHNLMVEPRRFEEQMRILTKRGYRFVSLSEYVERLAGNRRTEPICALTFDDGTLDNLHTLAPILRRLELPATIFACPGLLGEPHFAMPREAGVRLMDAGELRELASVPLVEIGSHTNRHVDLSGAGEQDAYEEMLSSRLALEELLQRPVETFAYPRCGYSPACPSAARRAGYRVAVTCGGRGGSDLHALARESIDPLDGRLGFALKSRRLFFPLRESPPGRLLRAASRRGRHGSQGS